MSIGYYVLDEHGEPLPTTSLEAEGQLRDGPSRRVAWTDIDDKTAVSTVFLCIDHSFEPNDKPVLWETMVRRNGYFNEQWRYSSRAEAEAGHTAVVAWLRGEGPKPE